MKKSSKHSKGRAIALYLCATLIGAAAVSAGVAVGFLINAHSYMHLPAVNDSRANASASNPRTYALSGTASGYKQ